MASLSSTWGKVAAAGAADRALNPEKYNVLDARKKAALAAEAGIVRGPGEVGSTLGGAVQTNRGAEDTFNRLTSYAQSKGWVGKADNGGIVGLADKTVEAGIQATVAAGIGYGAASALGLVGTAGSAGTTGAAGTSASSAGVGAGTTAGNAAAAGGSSTVATGTSIASKILSGASLASSALGLVAGAKSPDIGEPAPLPDTRAADEAARQKAARDALIESGRGRASTIAEGGMDAYNTQLARGSAAQKKRNASRDLLG